MHIAHVHYGVCGMLPQDFNLDCFWCIFEGKSEISGCLDGEFYLSMIHWALHTYTELHVTSNVIAACTCTDMYDKSSSVHCTSTCTFKILVPRALVINDYINFHSGY